MINFNRFVGGLAVLTCLLLTDKSVFATRPVIQTVIQTLAADKKYGDVTLPKGTKVELNGSYLHAATLHDSLTYCRIEFRSGTRFEFNETPGKQPWIYGAQLSAMHEVRSIKLPPRTEIRFADRSCTIDSFITHGTDINFGYAKLNGWISLYPNGRVKEAHTRSSLNIRGIHAVGHLTFWQNGRLQEFYSGKRQAIKGIPIPANVCVKLDQAGNPINFVLDKPHTFTNGRFQANDRVEVAEDGRARLVFRNEAGGAPMTNC